MDEPDRQRFADHWKARYGAPLDAPELARVLDPRWLAEVRIDLAVRRQAAALVRTIRGQRRARRRILAEPAPGTGETLNAMTRRAERLPIRAPGPPILAALLAEQEDQDERHVKVLERLSAESPWPADAGRRGKAVDWPLRYLCAWLAAWQRERRGKADWRDVVDALAWWGHPPMEPETARQYATRWPRPL